MVIQSVLTCCGWSSISSCCALQFDVIMLDVAAPDPSGSPGTLDSIPAQFLSDGFIEKGLLRRLRYMLGFQMYVCL